VEDENEEEEKKEKYHSSKMSFASSTCAQRKVKVRDMRETR